MPERVIAVTGGSGFIGRRVVEAHRQRGDEVRVLTRRAPRHPVARVSYIVGDLQAADEQSLRGFLHGVDVLYHCAGELRDTQRMHAVHVGGTQRLLRAASGRGLRWVQLSSVGVYGPYRSGIVTERTDAAPAGVYERTKAEADACVVGACAAGAIDAVVMRPSIVIGPGMPSPWLRSLGRAIERGVFAYLGRPGAIFNYVGVADVCRALMTAGDIAQAPSRVYNVSRSDTIEALVTHLAQAMNVEPPSRRIPEWIARGAAGIAGWVPRFPVTTQRVNALTNTSVYSSNLASDELHFTPHDELAALCRDIVASWQDSEAWAR